MAGADRPSITAQIIARAPRPPLIFGCILLVVALFLGYIGGAVLDSGHFAHRASDALDDRAVQSEVSKAVADSIPSAGGAFSSATIEPTIGSVIADPKFQKDFRGEVEDAHSTLVHGDADSASLKLKSLGPLVAKKLGAPAGLPAGASLPAVSLQVEPPSGVLSIVRTLDSLSWLPGALGLAALAFLAWQLFRAVDRADAVRSIAKTMLVAGVLMVILYFVARLLITSAAGGTGAVDGIVDAYFGDFAFASLILAGAGALGWIGAARFASAPRTKPVRPAAVPMKPPPRPSTVPSMAAEASEEETSVIAGQRARTDIPTIRVPSRDAPSPPAASREPATSSDPETKTCPDCAETVLAAARVCKHCGYRFETAR